MRSEAKQRRRSEAGLEGHSWKKATLIIIMMRGRGEGTEGEREASSGAVHV